MRRVGCRGTTRSGVGHFLKFGPSGQLDIAYFDQTKWSERFGHGIAYPGSFKSLRNFSTKNEKMTGLGHFLDFGSWDVLDIAYYDRTT